jgi:hypothetical protein
MDKVTLICDTNKFPTFLTYGVWYEAKKQGSYYIVVNNAEQTRRYKAEYFMTIDKYREKVINEILE